LIEQGDSMADAVDIQKDYRESGDRPLDLSSEQHKQASYHHGQGS
jgi:hypothetical protein